MYARPGAVARYPAPRTSPLAGGFSSIVMVKPRMSAVDPPGGPGGPASPPSSRWQGRWGRPALHSLGWRAAVPADREADGEVAGGDRDRPVDEVVHRVRLHGPQQPLRVGVPRCAGEVLEGDVDRGALRGTP